MLQTINVSSLFSSLRGRQPLNCKCLSLLNLILFIFCLQISIEHFIMPPPRGHNAVISVRRPSVRPSVCLSVCLSVRLMSHTSALTRKPKGIGRRNFAQGYPRSHATPTPTSRSKGQKPRSRGGVILWRPSSRTAEAPTELLPGERMQI